MLPRLEKVLRKASRKTRGKIVIIGHSLGSANSPVFLESRKARVGGQFRLSLWRIHNVQDWVAERGDLNPRNPCRIYTNPLRIIDAAFSAVVR
jgi:predicted alpha/beta hydrolase family esterase